MVEGAVGVGDGKCEPLRVDGLAVGVLKDYADEVGVLGEVYVVVVGAGLIGHYGTVD